VSVRLTESAVVASHRRLDDAHAIIDFASGEDVQNDVARVARLKSSPTGVLASGGFEVPVGRGFSSAARAPKVPLYGFTNERADFLFVHKCSQGPTPLARAQLPLRAGPQALMADQLYQQFR
jgi:hypothetical protein